mgnify:CR=1 FL=1
MFRTPPATVLVQARPRDELVRRQTRRRDPAAPERTRLGSRSAPPFPSLRYETFPEVGQNGRHNKGGVGSRVGAGWWMSVGREARVEQVEVEEGKGAQRRLQEERGSASALAGECGRSGRTSSPSLVHPRREKSRASMQSFEVALAARRAWRRCLMSAAGCTRWCGQAGCATGASRGWLTRASGDEESNPRREDDTLLVVVASRFPRPLRRLSQSSHAREHHLDRLRRPVRLLGRAPRPPDPARLRPPPPPDRLVLRLAAQPSRPARGRGRLAAHPRPGSGTQLGRHRGGQAGQDGRRLGSLRPLIVPRSSPSSRPLGLSCSPRQLADSSIMQQEAKLEVPFLRHEQTSSSTPLTLKSSLLFNSRLMRFSSTHLTGLRSHRAICIETDDSFEAMDWLRVKVDGEVDVPHEKRWSEDLLRSVVAGYWVGENTGHTAIKVRSFVSSPQSLLFPELTLSRPARSSPCRPSPPSARSTSSASASTFPPSPSSRSTTSRRSSPGPTSRSRTTAGSPWRRPASRSARRRTCRSPRSRRSSSPPLCDPLSV